MGKFGKNFGLPFGAIPASTYTGFYDYSGTSQVSCFSSFAGSTGLYFGWSAADIPSGATGVGPVLGATGIIFVGFGDAPSGFSLFSGASAFKPTINGATGGNIWAFSGFSNFQKSPGTQYFTNDNVLSFSSGSFSTTVNVSQFDSGTIRDARVVVGDIDGTTGFDIGGLELSLHPPFGSTGLLWNGLPNQFNYHGVTGMPSGKTLASRSYSAYAGATGQNFDFLWNGSTSVGNWVLNVGYTGFGSADLEFMTLCLTHAGEFSGYSAFSGTTTSACSGYSGITGFSGTDLTFVPFPPKITRPVASSEVEGTSALITWEPLKTDFTFDSGETEYDLEFTDNFDSDIGWSPIQNGLAGNMFSFLWDNEKIPNSDNIGLRIRSRLCDVPSEYYELPGPITIAPRPPSAPILIHPLGFETFDKQIPIVWEPANPKDIDGNDITYTIQYSRSASSEQGWKNVVTDLPGTTTSFLFDSSELGPGTDYGVRLFAVASDTGQTSEIQTVRGLTVAHSGFFIIDTQAPEAELVIENDFASSTRQNIKVRMRLEDDTSGVKGVRFKNEDEESFSDFDTPLEEKYWILSEGDGYKNVLLEAEDFAGNKTENLKINAVLRRFNETGAFVDAEVFNNKVYIGTGSDAKLYSFTAIGALVNEFTDADSITAMKTFRNNLYIATKDENDIGKIYVFNGSIFTLSKDFLVADTVVNTMEVFIDPETANNPSQTSNNILFAGLNGGEIYKFTTFWNIDFIASAGITKFKNVKPSIIGGLENLSKFVVYNGTWSEIEF